MYIMTTVIETSGGAYRKRMKPFNYKSGRKIVRRGRKVAAKRAGYGRTGLYNRGPNQNQNIKTPWLMGTKKWSYNMPYHESYAFTVPGTPETANTLVFTLNGMFDPEVPVGGHQPIGFDQAMAFFNHYTVTQCSWTITFTYNSPTSNDVIVCGYYISPTSTPITGADAIAENGLMKRKIISQNPGSGRSIAVMSGRIDLSKYFGKRILNEDDYRGDVAANPAEQAYLILFTHAITSTAGSSLLVDFTCNYNMLFSEPRKIAQS